MEINYLSVLIAISAALVSGMGTAVIASFRDSKKEQRRQIERDQDLLKMDLKLSLIHISEPTRPY